MFNNKSTNRWFVVFGAVLLQICLGAIYSWSLFSQPLIEKFSWSESDTYLTFSIIIFVFAFTTIFSGKLQDKFGPRIIATIGACLYGVGMMLTSTSTTLMELYLYYGVVSGIGIGFAYVCPLATCVKWFPDKKGFISGVAVGAFGLGSFVFKVVIVNLLEGVGVSGTFFYLGLIFLAVGVIGAQFLKVPSATLPGLEKVHYNKLSYSPKHMVKTKAFYLLWFMYFFGSINGLLVIGMATKIGTGMAGLTPQVAAGAVAIIGFFNAGGRLVWGSVSDKIGRELSFILMFILTAVALAVMAFIPLNYELFFISIAVVVSGFGGFLAIFPSITADYYGMENMGINYGIIYQAYGIAALVSSYLVFDDLTISFIVGSVLAAAGAVLTLILRKPEELEDV